VPEKKNGEQGEGQPQTISQNDGLRRVRRYLRLLQ